MQERTTPTASTVFADLRAAAVALLQAHPEVVRVDDAAIERLTTTLSAQEVTSKAARVGLPLKFGNSLEVRTGGAAC